MNDGRRADPTRRWPVYDEEQIEAATRVLRSGRTNYWTGEEGRRFEAEFARYAGVPHAVALANGTVALELALIALGVGAGDEVILPAASFIATAACVVARGAVPVFADVDRQTQTLNAKTVRECLSDRTRAIIAVHLYGCPCPMDDIVALARDHGLWVIEDCAQAHGARLHGRAVGGLGDAAAFSFCQDKIMSTGGEGGMLLCRDEAAWVRAWSYKDHGKPPSLRDRSPGPGYRWVHRGPGTNWRMTEFQAAIGRVQLRRLDAWVARRRELAGALRDRLAGLPLHLPAVPAAADHAWYRFPLRLCGDVAAAGRDDLLRELLARGVACTAGVCPELYREPSLKRFAPRRRLANASAIGETGFCLALDPALTDGELHRIGETVAAVVGGADLKKY